MEPLKQIIGATVSLVHRGSEVWVGPCPWHSSKSGTCLVVWADEGRWWCSSCKRGGDAIQWVRLLEGLSYREARERLGLPVATTRVARPQSVRVTLCQ